MATAKRPLGFATTREAAEFFRLPQTEVTRRANSGEWPSWVIGGRRVFNLDELVEQLAKDPKASEPQEAHTR